MEKVRNEFLLYEKSGFVSASLRCHEPNLDNSDKFQPYPLEIIEIQSFIYDNGWEQLVQVVLPDQPLRFELVKQNPRQVKRIQYVATPEGVYAV